MPEPTDNQNVFRPHEQHIMGWTRLGEFYMVDMALIQRLDFNGELYRHLCTLVKAGSAGAVEKTFVIDLVAASGDRSAVEYVTNWSNWIREGGLR